MNKRSHEAKQRGVPNRGSLYAVAAAHSKEAIDTLYDLMMNSKNDNVRLGAAKALLDKSLPDLKPSEDLERDHSKEVNISDEFAEKIRQMYLEPDTKKGVVLQS